MKVREHRCPNCKLACLFLNDHHYCTGCGNSHYCKGVPLDYPDGWNAPNTEPVRDTELEACVIVAEVYTMRAQGWRYLGWHRADDDGGLHLALRYRKTLVEATEEQEHHTLTESWQYILDILDKNKSGWRGERKYGWLPNDNAA